MKNKFVQMLLCGMFVVTLSGASIAEVGAAPTAGIISALSGSTATIETASSRENPKGTAESSLTAGVLTELLSSSTESTEATGIEPVVSTEEIENIENTEHRAISGVNGALADILIETELVTEETVEADVETIDTTETIEGTITEESTEAEETEEATTTETAHAGAVPEDVELAGETGEADEVSADEYANIGIATVTDYVNVRSEASSESEAVGKLYPNNAVNVLGTAGDGDWYKIESGDLKGYVSAEFVSVGDADLIKQATSRIATVHTETLFVRALPTQDSDIIGMVPDGEDLTVVDETYVDNWGWAGVSIEEGTGYVSMEFVDLSTAYTYGETKEAEQARLAKEEEERKAAEAAAAAKSQSSSSSAKASSGSSGGGYVSSGGSGTGGSVANYALQFVGNPYVYGGSSLTNGTDCSGFVMSVYANYGVGLPHSSSALRGVGYGVDVGSMAPGDIVCYSGHVGIYIGGGQIVHASTPATGIKVSSAYYRDILAVRRIF